MNGCFTVFKTSLENSKTTIEIVTGTIIAVMVSILIFDPKSEIGRFHLVNIYKDCHMTRYNLNWSKMKFWVQNFVFSCALDHILKK